MVKLTLLIAMLLISSAQAVTVAIIDSGVDMKHVKLHPWINPIEIANNDRDEDHNGYQDDVFGWNFAENNNQVIDYKYLGTFSQDPYLFFDIQLKTFLGTATETERAWAKSKIKDPAFIKEMMIFGNFVHGTHVAGITSMDEANNKVLAVKLIPTEVKLPIPSSKMLEEAEPSGIRISIIKGLLSQLTAQQAPVMHEIGAYVNIHKADVANGSFGTGVTQGNAIVTAMFKLLYKREPTEVEAASLVKYFLQESLRSANKLVSSAPNTLFVFAAGNEGNDNDKFPTSPASLDAPNVITVAATLNNNILASFSNYGVTTVDVAAPGVGIYSTIPGDSYLKVSGTSQAAPYVARIAGQIKSANPKLDVFSVKRILMETVDKKSYLKAKVMSEGVVNPTRALYVATQSKFFSLDQAIELGKRNIKDLATVKMGPIPTVEDFSNYILPLPSEYQVNF
ncbi:MAG: S8 family serine peptidase [Bacteriovoracaceae bacterium]